jgi:ribose transport system substrate-binding protein
MNKHLRTVVAITASLSILATACAGDEQTAEPGTDETEAQTDAEGAASTSEDFLLGIVTISADDAGNAKVIRGATAAAEERGWEVSVIDAAGSADQANAAMQNLVQKGADAILNLVFPVSSLGAGLKATTDAGIPVATWGGGLGDGVVVSNGAGGPQARPVVEKLIADMGGEGSVLALTYRTGQVCREREDVFDELVAETNIEVTKNEVSIPGFLQDGAQFATAWLAGHPAGSGPLAIWGCWEDPTIGAISSLKQQGRDDVLTYGQNGAPDGIKAVQEGWLTATFWADSQREGVSLVEEVERALAAGDSWEAEMVEVPGVVITADNVEQFIADHPEELS